MLATPLQRIGGPSAGEILGIIRTHQGVTRKGLQDRTGLGRSTISQRVGALLRVGFVTEMSTEQSTGGRPATDLRIAPGYGVVLAADLGATHSRLAVCDLSGAPLADHAEDIAIARGPDDVIAWMCRRFDALLRATGHRRGDVRSVGIGVPGPVEFSAQRAVSPPIMPGWDGVFIPDLVRRRFPVSVVVDNDVNVMALGEYWTHWRDDVRDLLFVKVGTGIGSGIIVGGGLHRGALGAAGDIGHVGVGDDRDAPCHCGNNGCLEARASGNAVAAQLRALGRTCADGRGVTALVREGDAHAVRLVRDAGRDIGHVLAAAVNILNPSVIVIGGDLSLADEPLLAGIREITYQRSTALATRHLPIVTSRLGDLAGVRGAATLAIDEVLSPAAVDRRLAEVGRPPP